MALKNSYEYGSGILRDPCLVSLLGDAGAFGQSPCLRSVMEALASRGIISSLSSHEPQHSDSISHEAESLSAKHGFERSAVLYARGAVSFALGSSDSAPEVPVSGHAGQGDDAGKKIAEQQ